MKDNNDKIMKNSRLFIILTRVQYGHKSPKDAHDEILSLLGENTEGVSHGGTLALRTDTKEDCTTCKWRHQHRFTYEGCYTCKKYDNWQSDRIIAER